jgi:3-hydroxymyristoyl/3-hydroxydecanoyl-(acyl carrier protein) dehydratase
MKKHPAGLLVPLFVCIAVLAQAGEFACLKQKETEKLATGIQNERFDRIMKLCDELEK